MDVSVIVLSYNSSAVLKNCLQSVLDHTKDLDFEIIAVDNASSDNSREIIKSFGNRVKFIQSPENKGFTGGNNLGIKAAKGEYILIINPDTRLLENSLYWLKTWMDAHTDVAVCTGQIVNSEQKIVPTGGYSPSLMRIIFWAFFVDDLPFINRFINSYHPHLEAVARYEHEFFPDWVTGACFFMRKDVIDKIGMLDENIFMYGEELEWCLRAKKNGWRVGHTPITKVSHLGGRSSGEIVPERWIVGEFRGLRYVYQKFYDPIHQYLLDIILVLAAFFRFLRWAVVFNRPMMKAYLKAMVS